MPDVDIESVAASLLRCGLPRTPPLVLVTRWTALLAGEAALFQDAAWEAGSAVPGSRYTFVACTDTGLCYLCAEHDDEFWSQDQPVWEPGPEFITPRNLIAWRRPLSVVSEVGLAGDPWQWLPLAPERVPAPVPRYLLRVAGDKVELPLNPPHRSGGVPDPRPVIDRLAAVWARSTTR